MPDQKEFEAQAKPIRRKLNDYANSIEQTKGWGKRAASNPQEKDNVLFFRGMMKSIDSTFNKFEVAWFELEGLQDQGAEGIPSESDNTVKKDARTAYFNAHKFAEEINQREAEATRDTAAEAAKFAATEAAKAAATEAAKAAATEAAKHAGAHSSSFNASMAMGGDYRVSKNLPKLQLPRFDGQQPSDWVKFRDSFMSLVDKDPFLSPVDKLNYLRSSLVGPAFSVISHLSVSDTNYEIAWKAILAEFDHKRMLASTYLDQILAAKPSPKANAESLKAFLSKVGDSVAAFKLLDIVHADEFILFHLAVRALDPVTRELFETANKDTTFPTVDSLIKFVRERTTTLMLSNTNISTSAPEPSAKGPKPPKPKNFNKNQGQTLLAQGKPPKKKNSLPNTSSTNSLAANPSSSSKRQGSCLVCKLHDHHLLSCEVFHSASVEDKWKMLTGWSGCVNCLTPTHTVDACSSKWKCRFCPERHHSSLHRSTKPQSSKNASSDSALNTVAHEEGQVVLGSAIVEIMDARGQYQPVRVVIDSGSQNSFMTIKCLNKLGLTMQHLRKRISGIGQTPFEGTKGKTVCTIRPRNKPAIQLRTEAIVVSNITSFLPSRLLPLDFVNRCSGFDLADPGFWKPAAVDFLVGADLFSQIMTGSIVPIDGSQASLFSSIFGYIVLGRISDSPQDEATSSLFTMDADEDLNQQLKRFWEIEESTIPPAFRNPEDEQCEEHFQKTHSRLPDGRYVVHLPFKQSPPNVGDSAYVARKRFLNLEKKLEANPVLKQSYHDTVNEYLELDHMTPASMPTRFVIPHHCITKEENNALKIRVVFDASVPVPNGSLNEHLLVGEKLQRDIKDVVLSFRQHQVVFSADIVKMFRMIVVDQQDRGYLQIYWRFNRQDEIQLLELKTLPFGLTCSPFIALRVIKQLCLDHGSPYPLAARVLNHDIYVDDVLTGAPSERDALVLKQQLVELLQKGGFRLSKWVTNSSSILNSIEDSTVKSVVSLADKEDSWVKLLGLQWDPEDDVFLFSFQTPTAIYSKRGILSAVARLYDPLGFLTPVTLMMKAIVQDLWKLSVNWDDNIPDQIKALWDTILSELHLLSSLRIPRFLHTSGNYECHVVGFSDASLKGYAAVLYLRVYIPEDQDWQVSLLTAKSKLAPTKAMSIPRLELCGALLLAQLYSANLPFLASLTSSLPPTLHTDSSIVLGWLNTPTYKLQTFVANRIARIQELTNMSSWRHVNSEQNPSDVASRGLLPSQLTSDELWWKGPSWLAEPQENWPAPTFTVSTDLPEIRSTALSLVVTYTEIQWISWMKQFSTFQKILRIMAWVKRWIYNVKHVGCCCCRMRTGPLKLFELELAMTDCVKWVQQHHLFHGHAFPQVEKSFANLQPFVDPKGLVRVGGRLRKANLSDAQRFPILLPTEAHLTSLMVDHYHKAYLHPGPNLLQAIIQKIFWVPSLRRVIRQRGFKCMTCYRSKAKATAPLMGDLPTYRVNGGRAFLHVGVDFAGPFQMKESSRRKAAVSKVYLCLFVCMATKALHLEAVTRLTTDAFLAALERFTSRRGLPSDIYSDRGSNFLGAANYLSELHNWFRASETKEELLNYATKARFDWHFNPPLTPHMGGIWEAGVKSVKSHLYKVAGNTVLTYEELSTLFYKIEAILNSRPLCPLSSSPEETDYLSPGHFLVGGPLVAIPQPSYLDTKENLLDRWQLVTLLGQRFWQRWKAEYLATLQKRPKWMERTENLQVGDIVLLKENSHPLSWPFAKVLEVRPGDDGIVRVATIKTPHATYQRPVVKLIPLLPLTQPSYPDS